VLPGENPGDLGEVGEIVYDSGGEKLLQRHGSERRVDASLRELRESIERLEGYGLAVLTDDACALDSVRALSVDQVTDDRPGAPALAALVRFDPAFGKLAEQRVEHVGRAPENVDRFRQIEAHGQRAPWMSCSAIRCSAAASSSVTR
jgi:hypothetical protein